MKHNLQQLYDYLKAELPPVFPYGKVYMREDIPNNIPPKVLKKVFAVYRKRLPQFSFGIDNILCIADASVTQTGRENIVFLPTGFLSNFYHTFYIPYGFIRDIEVPQACLDKDDKLMNNESKLTITYGPTDDESMTIHHRTIDKRRLYFVLSHIVKLEQEDYLARNE